MTKTQLSIKDVNEDLFREFKAESTREGLKIGQALNLAMQEWLKKKKRKSKTFMILNHPRGVKELKEQVKKLIRYFTNDNSY